MKIFKFGGASIKDAEGFKNVADIIRSEQSSRLLVVVSALGKTTNALEKILEAFYYGAREEGKNMLIAMAEEHCYMLRDIMGKEFKKVYPEITEFIVELTEYLNRDEFSENYNYVYDQVVSFGELFSSKMLYWYLNHEHIPAKWLDVRTVIRTDNNYREACVDWDKTVKKAQKIISPYYNSNNPITPSSPIVVTQGFIGGTSEKYSTTLGREGSDYSAAILAYVLDAESVTIWKDVEGLLNADPKIFEDTVKLDKIPYREAIELAYYGASIIHPKTLQPLQKKGIPLHVKSFADKEGTGSIISDFDIKRLVPCYIVKPNQVLISISPKDFSFIAEDNLSTIFGLFACFGVKINLMQSSAISFSLCVDNKSNIKELIEKLQTEFYVKYNFNMELFTIRYYNQGSIDKIIKNKTVILEQKNRTTVQYVIQSGG